MHDYETAQHMHVTLYSLYNQEVIEGLCSKDFKFHSLLLRLSITTIVTAKFYNRFQFKYLNHSNYLKIAT